MINHVLDWHKINWKAFELLTVYTAERAFIDVNFQEFLKRGNRQKGIDILHFSSNTGKHIAIQCKDVQKFTSKELQNVISAFEEHEFKNTSSVFILAIPLDMQKETMQNEVRKYEQYLFKKYNIAFYCWDINFFNKELRKYYHLVAKFFSQHDADEYCLPLPNRKDLPVNKQLCNYINRSVFENKHPHNSSERHFLQYGQPDKRSLSDYFREDRLNTHLVCLLADAHQGKTYLLRQTAYELENIEMPYVCLFLDIKTNNVKPIDQLIEINLRFWKELANKDMVVFIDGLDEVPSDKFEEMIRNIRDFNLLYPSVNIVFSCRKIFYSSYRVENIIGNFNIVELYPIQHDDIVRFTKQQLGDSYNRFNKLIERTNISSFLYDPFYLINLVEEYKTSSRKLPKSKIEIIEKYIERVISKAESRKLRNGYSILHQRKFFKQVSQKLAFAMQLLGVNSIRREDLDDVFSPEETELILHNGLLMEVNGKWSFTNAIFQEHLAAIALSKLPKEEIFGYVSIGKSIRKVKTKWIQTLSSLIAFLDHDNDLRKDIVEFIANDSIEFLFMMESSKFDEQFKIELIKQLFRQCSELNMTPRVTYEDKIAHFIASDEKVINIVIDFLCTVKATEVTKILSLRILRTVDLTNTQKDRILKYSRKFIHLMTDSYQAYLCLQVLAAHKIGSKKELDIFISHENLNDSYEYRDGVYQLITSLGKNDEYYNYGLNGISYLIKANSSIRHAMSEYSLEIFLASSNSAKNIAALFKALQSDEWVSFYQFASRRENFLKRITQRAIELYPINESIIFSVVQFVKFVSDKHVYKDYSEINRFFKETQTNWLAVRLLIEEIFGNNNWQIGYIITEDCLSYIFFEFEERGLTANMLWYCFAGMELTNRRELVNKFNQMADDVTANEYSTPTEKGKAHLDILQTSISNDTKVIASKQAFIKGVKTFYETSENNVVIRKEIYNDVESNPTKKNVISNFIKIFLFKWIDKKNDLIFLSDVLKRLEQKGFFEYFRAAEIMNYHYSISEETQAIYTEIVRQYYLEKIQEANFVNCIWDTSNGHRYKTLEIFLGTIFEKYLFDTPVDTLKKMVWLDSGGINNISSNSLNHKKTISEKLISKLQPEDLENFKAEICTNIRTGILCKSVLGSHIELCGHLKIFDSTDSILNVIKNKELKDYELPDAIDIYLSLEGSLHELIAIFKKMVAYNSYTYWHLVSVLYKGHSDIVVKSLRKAVVSDVTNEEHKIDAAKHMANLGDLNGFKFLIDHIKKRNESPFTINTSVIVYNVDTSKALELMDELMYLTLDKNRNGKDFHESPGNLLLEWLYGFASKSEEDTILIYQFLMKQKNKYNNMYSNYKDFNWFAARVIYDFRNSEKANKTLPQVKDILLKIY